MAEPYSLEIMEVMILEKFGLKIMGVLSQEILKKVIQFR